MKTIKVLITVLIITLLASCSNSSSTPQTINFDRMEFSYVGITDDDYLLFESGNFRLELIENDDETVTISYEKFQDIYIIEGTKEDYKIRKNGILVQICTGEEEISCTGFAQVDFSKDAANLFDIYPENTLSSSMIIIGVLILVGVVSLFFIPKKYFKIVKINNFKITQVLLIRTFIIMLILVGAVIIILSF